MGRRRVSRKGALSAFLALALGWGVADDAVAASSKPKNTSPPTISGTAMVGQPLTASPGTWSGTLPISFSYEWQRCNVDGGGCKSINGANLPQYVAAAGDLGKRLRIRVTGKNSAGSAVGTSAATDVVVPVPVAPSNSAPPVVSGEAREGATLSASTGG